MTWRARWLLLAVFLAGLVLATVALAGSGPRSISAHGVRLLVPRAWQRVEAASDGPVSDPRTLLVAGTAGVHPRRSRCQIAAYHVPATGAVVVVVGWKSVAAAGGGAGKPGRAPLQRLRALQRASFECFPGRGAVAQLLLRGRLYQVNVIVGERASQQRVAEALAVARSFELAH